MRVTGRPLVATAIVALLLAACGGTSPTPAASSGGSSAAPSAVAQNEPPPDDASVQEKLDWLASSGLTGADRRAFLVEQAAATGPVVMYGSLNESLLQGWQERLSQEFPELQIQILRLQDGYDRIRLESSAGIPNVSVFDGDPQDMALLLTEGKYLASYHSPELDGLDVAEGVEQVDGLYTVHSWQPMLAVYNTDLMTDDQMPDTLAEIADPSFDTPFARSRFGARWIAAIYQAMGEQDGLKLVQDIAAHKPVIFNSNTAMREAVIAGQYPFAIDTQFSGIRNSIADGAPISWHLIQPAFLDVGQMAILQDAPNPYGAVLVYDWVLSHDGGQQSFISDTLGVRSDLDYQVEDFQDLVATGIGYTPELIIESADTEQVWEDLFLQ